MYRLYLNSEGWKILNISRYEEEIVNCLIDEHNKNKHSYFMIIKCFNNTDEIVTITRSEDDIVNYLNEFKERKRLDNISILELKRYIINRRLK